MFIKKDKDGEWYVCRRTSHGNQNKVGSVKHDTAVYRNWFLIKYHVSKRSYTGRLYVKNITIPQEFVGKKIRLKVEVIEENERKNIL